MSERESLAERIREVLKIGLNPYGRIIFAGKPEDWKIILEALSQSKGGRVGEVDTPAEILAARLMDAWYADKGHKLPWAKAVQIAAIVTKQSDSERDRLLKLGDDDGSCEMCGLRGQEEPVAWNADKIRSFWESAEVSALADGTEKDPTFAAVVNVYMTGLRHGYAHPERGAMERLRIALRYIQLDSQGYEGKLGRINNIATDALAAPEQPAGEKKGESK